MAIHSDANLERSRRDADSNSYTYPTPTCAEWTVNNASKDNTDMQGRTGIRVLCFYRLRYGLANGYVVLVLK